MKFIPKLIASVACVAAASAAGAATVTVKFDDPLFTGFTGTAYDAVKISAKSGVVTKSWNVNAGRFQGTASNVVGVPESIFVDGLSDLYAYCYDIYEGIQGGQTVHYTINFDSVFSRTLDFLGAVNSVLSAGGTYNPYAWLHPTNGYMGAAIQLGIWESKYDLSGWSLSGGSFKATGVESATLGFYNQFIGAIDSTDALESKYVMVLEAPGAQDMIVGDPPPSAVPEPSTLFLAGGALLAMASAQRRRARKAVD